MPLLSLLFFLRRLLLDIDSGRGRFGNGTCKDVFSEHEKAIVEFAQVEDAHFLPEFAPVRSQNGNEVGEDAISEDVCLRVPAFGHTTRVHVHVLALVDGVALDLEVILRWLRLWIEHPELEDPLGFSPGSNGGVDRGGGVLNNFLSECIMVNLTITYKLTFKLTWR